MPQYQNLPKSIKAHLLATKYGKTLQDATYTHQSTLTPLNLQYPIPKSDWNVLKLSHTTNRISFLLYEDFDTTPHPALLKSSIYNPETGEIKELSYEGRNNPPILHRKELFVTPDYPHYNLFKSLTEAEEEAGLYQDTKRIGFRTFWDSLLKKKGLTIQDHQLIKTPTIQPTQTDLPDTIHRHRTAIQRYEPSRPVKSLLVNDLLTNKTFFDYGCGHGDDLAALQNLSIEANGWDPHYQPDNEKIPSQVVNLGFVLNVIEEEQERKKTLSDAYDLCSELLVVGVMHEHQMNYTAAQPHKDGYLTTRNTFQKYFAQEEIASFIEGVTGEEPIAIGLGLFYAFKCESAKQDFVASTVRRKLDWDALRTRERKERVYAPRLNKYQKYQGLFDSFWHTCLEYGRTPIPGEYVQLSELRRVAGSLPKAFDILQAEYNFELYDESKVSRVADLLVYFCMAQFKKRVPFNSLSKSLQTDIKLFFGNVSNLEEQAMELLMKAGNPEEVTKACRSVPFGRLDKEFFQFHSSYVNQLPLLLRIYVGCGSILYGQVKDADVIKIHKNSGKLSIMFYDNFWKNAHPVLKLRVKLKLRGQGVDVFDYDNLDTAQLLYEKDSLLADDHPKFKLFSKLTEQEMAAGLLRFSGYGPNQEEWEALLNARGVQLKGHKLIK